MSTTTIPEATVPPPAFQTAKQARRLSRSQGLFAPDLLRTALKQSVIMLRPDIQWKNPVMFVVEVGTVLSIIFTFAALLGQGGQTPVTYLVALDIWLLLTVLFANFASALAEARGKAQADALRKTRQETLAYRVRNAERGTRSDPELFSSALNAPRSAFEETVSTALKEGDLIVV